MTNDELRVAIAKVKGIYTGFFDPVSGTKVQLIKLPDGRDWVIPLPDWTTDIAAAWELEGEIPPAEVERYVLELTRIINAKEDFSTSQRWQLIHATPRERCEAWLAWKAAK